MDLQKREKRILESIVKNYIYFAEPIGSRAISKSAKLGISPATIRNVMMDLEEAGLISQPHTSAGRIPTDKGFRVYVNELIKYEELTPKEKKRIQDHLNILYNNIDEVLKNTSYILSRLSNQFSMVLSPKVSRIIVKKLELMRIAAGKILVLITFKEGPIKSIVLAMDTDIPTHQIEETSRLLNERLNGLTIQEIMESIKLRFHDVHRGNAKLLEVIINSAPILFSNQKEESIFCDGAMLVTNQPEFEERKNLETIIYLLEHKEIIANILSNRSNTEGITITIGDENPEQEIQQFTVITTVYRLSGDWGIIGLIGPKRMRYSKLIPLINYTTSRVDELFGGN